MIYSQEFEKWIPTIKNPNICQSCNAKFNCLFVCPSFDINYSDIIEPSKHNNHLGPIKHVYVTYSKEKQIRHSSSSGGFIRTLGKKLLENKFIDGILSLKHEKELNYRYSYFDKNMELPNSIYHSLNFEDGLNLLKEIEGKILLIGLPCYITSINLLFKKKKFQHLKNKIKYSIALFCGYSLDRSNVHSFGCYNKMNIKSIRYRTGGRYRKTIISDGSKTKIFDIIKPRSLSEKINNDILMDHYLVSGGCLHCMDHLGIVADLSVGDAWLPRYNNDYEGRNLVITRNTKGEEAYSCVESSLVSENATTEDIINSQSELYALAKLAKAINLYSSYRGKYYPNHILNSNKNNIPPLSWRIKISINLIKQLIRKKKYKQARFLYILINLKKYIIFYVHKNFNYRSNSSQ
ncbi:MAG: Coenzyme F420 hydrogenase/dehydrogenase, beta subunit C-terminal domain [bacterium]